MKVSALKRAASEPFLHFTVLGALAFAVHSLAAGAAEVPAIEVSAERQRELVKMFEQRQRRAPTAEERRHLLRRHVEDEVLFREGLRLSLPSTDPMLRAQVIARVRSLLQAEVQSAGAAAANDEAGRERVSRQFQAEVDRLAAGFRVRVAGAP